MTTFAEFLRLIEAIPATFWGVVVGSFFSIAAVAQTNRAGDRRLRSQFEHEREQKTKDREMALRKEVYLGVAEAVAAGMNAISRFSNLDLPTDQITNAYVDKAPAIPKAHVIARTGTVQALARFTGELNTIYLKLFARRFELLRDKNAITFLDDQIVVFGKERDRALEIIKQHNIEGVVDERRWKILQQNYEFEQKRINETVSRRAELAGVLNPIQLEFMRECVTHTSKLVQLIVPVLSAMRAELELPLDEHAYRQVMEEGIVNQQVAIDAFINKFMPAAVQPNIQTDAAR